MEMYTIPEACEVSGVNAQTLRNWVTAGLIRPAHLGTTGTGNGHRFSLVQVLALTAGVRYRAEGAGPEWVTGVVYLLCGMTIERLEAELDAGRTFPTPAHLMNRASADEGVIPPAAWLPGKLDEPPTDPVVRDLVRRLDLKRLYEEVKQKVENLAGRPANRRNRKRSLTESEGRMK